MKTTLMIGLVMVLGFAGCGLPPAQQANRDARILNLESKVLALEEELNESKKNVETLMAVSEKQGQVIETLLRAAKAHGASISNLEVEVSGIRK